ncbi:MAG: hypothetical protein HOV66_03060 [Streptomycetaceae bacterium]|nr:hypothetical protein [Streptomycetaceae bacterium]
MAVYRVSTPVPGASGDVGGVHFADGVALVDEETDAAVLAYCRAAGYTVEPADGQADLDEEETPKPTRRTRSSKETTA